MYPEDITDYGDLKMPEKELLAAIIQRATLDYCGIECTAKHWQDIGRLAETWIYCSDTSEFSFTWICAELNINPRKMRAAIERYKKTRSQFFLNGTFKAKGRGALRRRVQKKGPNGPPLSNS